ncbi:MAG: biotin/lipoyl-binding protein, partial [Terracidiphilus sp.]
MWKKPLVMGITGAAAVALVGVVCASWLRHDDTLVGSGTVEARDIRIGSKVGGRIDKVLVREGDTVKTGELLITFDDRELKATLEQSQANMERMERGSRPEEIAEARAAAAQAKADLEERKNGYRREDIEAAQADLERTEADEHRTQLDYRRDQDLLQSGVISRQQYDAGEASWKVAEAQRRNAQQKLEELQRGYRPEEIASAESHYRQLQATLDKLVNGNRSEDIESARAQYAYDQSRFREASIVAPADATVEVLDIRPGDLIAPNTTIATLIESDQIYVRIYVPETKIGLVR